jgi:pimeloyl-ACP methyl ester carboxylesterase
MTARVRTPVLDVAYETWGPEDGAPVMVVHGWPDDASCWLRVAGLLAAAGCRVHAPYLRGFAPTRFLDPATPRTGQISALAQDLADVLEALDLRDVVVAGHDWGGRAAFGVAALWPERLRGLVAISVPYLPAPPPVGDLAQEHAYWYQWFFTTERGRRALRDDRRHLCRYLWRTWAPGWAFEDGEFERAAAAWEGDDWPAVTAHSYASRWGEAELDPAYAEVQARLSEGRPIGVPTIVLHGADDGATLPSATEGQDARFTGGYAREVLPAVGHFPPREAPAEVAAAILRLVREGRVA